MNNAIRTGEIAFNTYWGDDTEYLELREFFESKASALYEHEIKKQREKGKVEKEAFWASGNRNNYGCFDYDGRHICFLASNSFIGMMKSQYM